MGSQPSQTEKKRSNKSASQKAGVLEISRQYPRMSLSGSLPRRAPAVTPSATPSSPLSSHAAASTPAEFASPLPDYLQDRLAIEQRCTEVAVQRVASQPRYRSGKRRADAPICLQLADLLLAHGAQGGLAYVGLQGIERRGRHEQKSRKAHAQEQKRHPDQLFPRKLSRCSLLSSLLYLTPAPSSTGLHC